jgi:hypothetical protein
MQIECNIVLPPETDVRKRFLPERFPSSSGITPERELPQMAK